MPAWLADRLLDVRLVAALALVIVAAALAPTLWAALRPPTVRFDVQVETLLAPSGEFTIGWSPSRTDREGLVVRRWRPDGTAEILATVQVAIGDLNDSQRLGTNDFAMVCPGSDGAPAPQRYLFGAVGWMLWSARGVADDLLAYDGPPATGARFDGGLYLVVLDDVAADPDTALVLRRSNRFWERSVRVFDDVLRYGRQQASGCLVA